MGYKTRFTTKIIRIDHELKFPHNVQAAYLKSILGNVPDEAELVSYDDDSDWITFVFRVEREEEK